MPKQKIKIEPFSDFVFLKFFKEQKSKSGIILSDVNKSKPVKAEVLSAGPGRLDRHGNFVKTTVKAGDIVLIDPFLPREIKVESEDFLVMRESEIFAKLIN